MIQRKAMEQKAKDDVPDVLKLQKGTTLASWADSMRVFLSKVTSARGISTMAYATKKEEQVPIVPPALSPYQQHFLDHGLVKDKYENRFLHSDVRFQSNNGTLFGSPEEATRGTTFTYSIKTYKLTRNCHAEWIALNICSTLERARGDKN